VFGDQVGGDLRNWETRTSGPVAEPFSSVGRRADIDRNRGLPRHQRPDLLLQRPGLDDRKGRATLEVNASDAFGSAFGQKDIKLKK